MSKNFIKYNEFEKIDIRLGTIIEAEEYDKLNKPSILLKIDFGNEIGIKKSSAQLRKNYNSKELINKQIVAVVNFYPKQIGKIISEVLVLGLPDNEDEPILISPPKKMKEKNKSDEIIKLAIKRMIPRGPLGKLQLSNCKIYRDENHKHEAQNPEIIDIESMNRKNKI